MTGAQRHEQVERLRPAHLADDQPVRAHPQRVAHEPADRDLAAALQVRRPRLEPHHVRQREPQLGRVLDRHHALGGIDERGERAERRRLARAGAAADQQRAARARPRGRGSRAAAASASRARRRSAGAKPRGRKRRIVSSGPSSASGGSTTFTREPSGSRASHSGSASSARRPSGARIRSIAWRSSASLAKRTSVCASRPAALDPHRRGPADEQLVDGRVAQQRLQRPEPDRRARPPARRAAARVAASSTPASRSTSAPIRAAGRRRRRLARPLDEPVAQRAGERVEGCREGGPSHVDRPQPGGSRPRGWRSPTRRAGAA